MERLSGLERVSYMARRLKLPPILRRFGFLNRYRKAKVRSSLFENI